MGPRSIWIHCLTESYPIEVTESQALPQKPGGGWLRKDEALEERTCGRRLRPKTLCEVSSSGIPDPRFWDEADFGRLRWSTDDPS